MANLRAVNYDDTIHPHDADLRWPASAIWRSGEPAVRSIRIHDLRDVLAKGIDDFKAVPSHAVFLGIIYALLGLVLIRLWFDGNIVPLVYPLLAGLTLLGPFAAVTLYEVSRRREMGLDTSVWHLTEVFHSPSIGAITRLGLLLMAIFFIWLGTAQTMYVQIMGGARPASFGAFLHDVLTTPAGRELMVVGNAVGLLFALLVLVISVVSFPMLVDRKVSVGTAVRTSVRAVIASPVAMAAWGLIVAAGLLLGSLPLFFGLAVVFPVLGHATWHLYRKVVSRDEVI